MVTRPPSRSYYLTGVTAAGRSRLPTLVLVRVPPCRARINRIILAGCNIFEDISSVGTFVHFSPTNITRIKVVSEG